MKSLKSIQELLAKDLNTGIPYLRNLLDPEVYYNQYLGGASSILVALLQIHLRTDGNDWDKAKWMDDCLITNFWLTNKELSLGGIAIWGQGGTTEQWTDPFFFEVALDKQHVDFSRYLFLFGDMDREAVSYSRFTKNRDSWDQENRNWQYLIEVK